MKKLGWIFTVMALLTIVGCSNNSTKSTNDSQTKSTNTASVFYQNLNKQDKKNVRFTFSEDEDQTADEIADPVYVVSMKVKNNSNKTIKFDQSKFILIASKTTKFTSAKTGTLTLKPGKQTTVNQLIENVGEQALVSDDSIFVYLNDSNKIGTANFANKKSDSTSTTSSKSNTDSNSNKAADDSTSQTTQDSSHIITSSDMALSLYLHAMAVDPDAYADADVQEVSNGYRISLWPGSSSVISFAGDEIDDNGEVTPFSQLVGPTHSSSGWVYNGHNYNQ
ncbi:hypothetical protein [Companilactobacillus ginsenosidimutans]|uniref:DUF5067 domain-containing protein n=1 Tax=Companilactobacillus ginsenosidimutans TaxID=1007676 RepID=A0A0H4R256_9LACO|nr:hypothetical protein [Companilactobacillus ginsenosidimutans]AKP67820.1 hypothetical protein ABM34_09945 [Companilactobacillus ginsenosidimutans]